MNFESACQLSHVIDARKAYLTPDMLQMHVLYNRKAVHIGSPNDGKYEFSV